jgi:hypothetical protein
MKISRLVAIGVTWGKSLILRATNLRDQEVEGSNPFAPTIIPHCFMKVAIAGARCMFNVSALCPIFAHLVFQRQ